MASILYNLTIFPLEAIIEFFYLLFVRVSHSPGIAVMGIGLAVNVLALPLYAKAEGWQMVERGIQKRLKPKIDDIKAVFKGDERLMILSTYYRQNNYHPIYALRSSFGLILQIPFFIAAYAFISRLPALHGQGFLFIRDLGAQDGLARLGRLSVNLLPILMTLVNIAASAVYTRGLERREKIQLYAMALIFLVLLYGSSAALVLYWTFNNLFSLFKNIVFKARRPLAIFYGIMSALALGAVLSALFALETTARKRLVVVVIAALVWLSPLIARLASKALDKFVLPALRDAGLRFRVFLLATLSLCLLVGAVIPGNLIASSAQEFSFIKGHESPFSFLLWTFSQSAGIFFVWPLVLYLLFGERVRASMAAFFAILLALSVVDAFAFPGNYGTISQQLVFSNAGLLKATLALNALNLAALGAAALIALALFVGKRPLVMRGALVITLVSFLGLAGLRATAIAGDFAQLAKRRSSDSLATSSSLEPVYHLSREGKNVIVFMLDRAISGFVPYIMAEDRAIAKSFEGFVWYPNTLSYNGHTLAGAPPLFGGYDYIPEEINKRSGETLVAKHDEALSVMPRIFAEAGWDSTISDASWANYSWVPDNNIFSRYPGIRAFNLEGRYTQTWLTEHGMESDPSARILRNLIWFGIFRISPVALRNGLYDNGKWWDSAFKPDEYADFIDKYSALDYLDRLVDFSAAKNTFTLIVNNTTHETVPLAYPGYVPSRKLKTEEVREFADAFTWNTYEVDMAVFRMLGRFFDRLRAEGVYDNTKIIMVSDHGAILSVPAFSSFKRVETPSLFNSFLLVKDFAAKGPLERNDRFRTNGDVPALATSILGKVVNPFTGKPLRELPPDGTVDVVDSGIYDPSSQNLTTMRFGPENIIKVSGNIFEESNWRLPR